MKKSILIFLFFTSQLIFSQQDCSTAVPVCSDADISMTPNGYGDVKEGTVGCLGSGGESNSLWFTFSVQTAGTLTFLVTPAQINIDYDFALYGPNHNCSNLTASPIRCSYASIDIGIVNPTGLSLTATDLSEGAIGDGYVRYLDVLPGEVYYLLLNNYSTQISPFSLTFGGTATLLTPFDNNSTQTHQPFPFVEPGPLNDGNIDICGNNIPFDFSTLSAQILNGNPNHFVVKYFTSAANAADDAAPIVGPYNINVANTYHYSISYVDPVSPTTFLNKCREFGTINFHDRSFNLTPVTLTSCNNNGSGVALFDLTSANVGVPPGVTVNYYATMADANAGINEIANPNAYTSAEGIVYVKGVNQYNCTSIAAITLRFFPAFTIADATLRECFIEAAPTTATFDLTTAPVTVGAGTFTKKYFPSEADAINGTNEILNPDNFTSPSGVVYVRVENGNACYMIAKITLVVIPPVPSTVLVDKTICIEDKTTLDAGPGFTAYEWSTGATTQSITDVSVGTYWVKLTTGNCTTMQSVKVYPAAAPVVSSIDIGANKITINVVGGVPPYKYSIDKIVWQDSNVFENIKRGEVTVYIKDSYDCDPIEITVTIPNILNVITPNGDGVNDVIDYSGLSMKENLIFNIYDRYGVKIHQADKKNGYKWDGTVQGKKVNTGTYWYSVTWNEKDKAKTPIQYSGWVMVKNRE